MTFSLVPMTSAFAGEISRWHYGGIHSFHDFERDAEDLAELLDPRSWEETYHAVTDGSGELVGFFCFKRKEEKTGAGLNVGVGLGLRPDLCGKGLGGEFLRAGLVFAGERYRPARFLLSVADFNERAIKLYRRVGFESDGYFMNDTNGGRYRFLRMVRKA